jgi:SPP1 family predicted phage head-tail adaptor
VKPHRLRHRITIEAPDYIQDSDTGELTFTWTPVACDVPASIEALSAREFIQSASKQGEVTARIMIRFIPNITEAMRIKHDGIIYDIVGVLPDKDSGIHYLTMPVKRGVNQGD